MYHYRPSAVACGSQKITKIWLKRKGKHCIFYVYIYWHLMIDEKSTSSKETMAKNGLHKWQYKIKNNFIILLVFFFFRASSTATSNPFLIISSEQQQLLSERNQLSISSALSSLQAERCFSFIRFIFKASSAGCAGFDLDLILVAQKTLCFYLHLAF